MEFYNAFISKIQEKYKNKTDAKDIKQKNQYIRVAEFSKDIENIENINNFIEKLNQQDFKQSTKSKYIKNITTLFHIIENDTLYNLYNKYSFELKKIIDKTPKDPIILNKSTVSKYEYDTLIHNLYTKYPPLRTDVCTVKLRDFDEKENYYKEGTLYFNNLVKVKKEYSLKIKLNEDDSNIIEKLKEQNNYLFETNSKDRNQAFVEYLKSTFDKGVQEFRREHFSKFILKNEINIKSINKLYDMSIGKAYDDCNIIINDKDVQDYIKLFHLCNSSNTSIQQVVFNYYREFV